MRCKGVPLSEVIFVLVSLVLMSKESEARHDVRRRSHQHLAVCRKEFLRPLEKRIADVDLVFVGIVERIYQQVEASEEQVGGGERRRRQQVGDGVSRRLRHHHPHRHRHLSRGAQHRHQRHQHRQHDVRSFSQSSSDWIPGSGGSGPVTAGNAVSVFYRGIVRVKRVIRGDKRFQGNRLIVEGFGSDKFCVSDAKERDTRIIFANPLPNGRIRLHSSLMHVNQENLRKVHIAAKAAALAENLKTSDKQSTPAVPTIETTTATTSTTTAATTTVATTSTTSAPPLLLLQSSQSLIRPLDAGEKAGETVSTAGNEIGSGDRNETAAKRKGLKKKKKKSKAGGKSRLHKHRRKHRRLDLSSSSTTPATGDSSTVSLLEEAMMT